MLLNSLFKYWTYRLFAPGVILRGTYDAFRELLNHDSHSHELMADLEALYYQGKKEDFSRITARYNALAESVEAMVECLERMAPGSFVTLREYFRKFDFYSRLSLAPPSIHFGPPFLLPLTSRDLTPALAGNKSTTLARITQELDISTPRGYVITANSFHYLLEYNDLRAAINALLAQIDLTVPESLTRIATSLRDLILKAEIPPDIHQAMVAIHDDIFAPTSTAPPRTAVRSSAVHEDGDCSFAGQYATLLDVEPQNLTIAYLTVLASKYSPEALSYRIHSGLSDEETPMAVLVVEMVDASHSGVLYTADPAGEDNTHLFIHTVPGQGEALVSGRVIPECLMIEKEHVPAHQRQDVPAASHPFSPLRLTDTQALDLARAALQIESHFGAPQDIEWAIRADGSICLLQSRPLQTNVAPSPPSSLQINDSAPLIQGGIMAAAGQACGMVWCMNADHPLEEMPAGVILVLKETLPSHVRILDRVSGVLAELGSVAGHFSTVCREFGIPLLCGLESALRVIEHGQTITMDATNSKVYSGNLLAAIHTAPDHQLRPHLPFYRKLRRLLDSITPLHLTDPQAPEFSPASCRSLHDIVRFTHEQALKTMFALGDRLSNRSHGRKKLLSTLPFDIFVVDVGDGLAPASAETDQISPDQICSLPFLALWTGLTHPSVQWEDRAHFDWKHFGEATLADGIASSSDPRFASYAVLGADYVNLNMRFGYHFTLVDTVCGADSASNYCQFRFAGGGGNFTGRLLRIEFLSTLLIKAGFQVEARGDLLDARISSLPVPEMQTRLTTLGQLLGATKLMDMALHDHTEVQEYIADFQGKSDQTQTTP